jgi:hypothetical protein
MKFRENSAKVTLPVALIILAGSIIFVSGTGTAVGATTTNKIIQTLQAQMKKLQARVTELEDNPVSLPGEPGEVGPQGPPGSDVSKYIYRGIISSRDIVFDGPVTQIAQGKRFILAKIRATDIPEPGSYELTAHLAGSWSTNAPSNAYIECFFQQETVYLANVNNKDNFGAARYGGARAEFGTWTGLNLFVTGDYGSGTLAKDPIYLVCSTLGSIRNLTGIVKVNVFSIPQSMVFTD